MKTYWFTPLLNSIFLVLLIWLGNSCVPTQQVFTDYDRSAHLSEYQTFGWADPVFIEARNNPLYYNELNDKRIKDAVAVQMQTRNYKYSDNPDLLIHYHIIIEDKTAVRTDPYGYYGPYWMRTQVDVYQYREGTLIIDLMDANNKNLLWRGWITSFLKNQGPEKMDASISDGVRKIFAEYPYRASIIDQKQIN